MKKTRLYLFLGILLISSLLASCTGAGATTSWPGVTVDGERETIYLAGGAHIYAVDINNGREKWRFPEKPSNSVSFYAAPELAEDGHLIVPGYDNILYGLNPDEFEATNLSFLDVRGVSVEQAIEDGLAKLDLNESDVFVEIKVQGSAGIFGFGSSPSCVRLTIKDAEGSEAAAAADDTPCDPTEWMFSGATNRYVAAPLAAKDLIFAPNADNNLYVLNSSGGLRWQYEVDHTLWSQPVVNGEVVYLPSMDHHVYAIDIESGDEVWRSDDLGGAIAGNPTLSPEGVLYIGTLGSELVALDTNQNGAVLWRFTAENWVWSGPTLDGDLLYFGDLGGTLYAVNAADGTEEWQEKLGGEENAAISDKPLLVGDNLFIVTQDGKVHSLDKTNQKKRVNTIEKASLYGSPVLAGDLIIVAPIGADAMLYAYDLEGNQDWQFIPE